MPRSNRPRRPVSGKAGSGKAGSGKAGAGKAGAGKAGAGKAGAGKAGAGKAGAGKAGAGKAAKPGARRGPVPEPDLERARTGIARRESAPDGNWIVRSITASRAEKTYICPGCSTAVMPGVAHLVVWSEDHLFGAAAGLAERRHWHSNCWTSRRYRYR